MSDDEQDAYCLTCGKVIHFVMRDGECECRVPVLPQEQP